MSEHSPLLRVEALTKFYPPRRRVLFGNGHESIQAVRGVSFALNPGETLGLVGESGSGKTTMARLIVGLEKPTTGFIQYRGRLPHQISSQEMRAFRRNIQMVFQDPDSSLNPRHSAGRIVAEPLMAHGDVIAKHERERRVVELLRLVGLPRAYTGAYPRQLSGGQRQRVAIARALILNPEVVVCDEPTSALDVSVQAQIVNLLQSLQAKLGVSYLFISHDLRLVRHIAHRVAVMYLGKIVEMGNTQGVFENPAHPYTQALLSVVPVTYPWREQRERIVLGGEIPSPTQPPSGCAFRTRCWKATDICREVEPELVERLGQLSACHHVN